MITWTYVPYGSDCQTHIQFARDAFYKYFFFKFCFSYEIFNSFTIWLMFQVNNVCFNHNMDINQLIDCMECEYCICCDFDRFEHAQIFL